jgi:hypothetical protein
MKAKYTTAELARIEPEAHHKHPRKGKCKSSCFTNGYHRVGLVELESVLDGASPGNVGNHACLECGKIFSGFNDRFFVPRNQPNAIKRGES